MIAPKAGIRRLGHAITGTLIRKDLCGLSPPGCRGQGHAIDPLVEQLAWVLGLEHDWRIAILTHRLSLE
jgi:hypothetical protein